MFAFRFSSRSESWVNRDGLMNRSFTRVGHSLILTRGSLPTDVIADLGTLLPELIFLTKSRSAQEETTGCRRGLRTFGPAKPFSSRNIALMTQVTILVWLPHLMCSLTKIGLMKQLPSPPTSIARLFVAVPLPRFRHEHFAAPAPGSASRGRHGRIS